MSINQEVLVPEAVNHGIDRDSVFDPNPYFDQWFHELEVSRTERAAKDDPADDSARMSIESLPGSNCEVTFEGVLHFDGHSMGNIRSAGGALIITKKGRVDADIDVGVAVINGAVIGNITASERVFLDSDALVKGQILTRRLSVKPGAIFEGDCVFIDGQDSPSTQTESLEEQEELEYLLASV
ncbi:MAG TPA: polymer-forming cytoskeletal protein [Pyrinomonadaceae bacterium]|nr:polymer-forming cytoskeletal protein [Pyrinomonadaceae bacterium]